MPAEGRGENTDFLQHPFVDLEEICVFAPSFGWHVEALTFSPIKGPAGNIEFLADIRPGEGCAPDSEQISALVRSAHAELR